MKFNYRGWSVVALLHVFLALSFVDRMIINLMVDPIRTDLKINDTQMSLLMGLSFVLFFFIMGIPIARLADRYSRKWIIVLAVGAWSFMTMLCGFANSYLLLLTARFGVGVGEGGYAPAAYSMISDYFSRDKLARATSVYVAGINVGIGATFIFGAKLFAYLAHTGGAALPLLAGLRSWQQAFVIVGIPGLILVPFLLMIREPARTGVVPAYRTHAGGEPKAPAIIAFIKERRRALISHVLGFSFFTILDLAFLSWIPTYYFRVRGETVELIGPTFGWMYILLGIAGTIAGARLVEILHSRGYYDGIFRLGATASVVLLPVIWLVILLPGNWSFVALSVQMFIEAIPWGVAAAAILLITPNQFRAVFSAIYLLTVNVIGMTLGPLAVGLLDDYAFRNDMKVGVSIAIVCSVCLVGSCAAFVYGRKAYGEAVVAMNNAAADSAAA